MRTYGVQRLANPPLVEAEFAPPRFGSKNWLRFFISVCPQPLRPRAGARSAAKDSVLCRFQPYRAHLYPKPLRATPNPINKNWLRSFRMGLAQNPSAPRPRPIHRERLGRHDPAGFKPSAPPEAKSQFSNLNRINRNWLRSFILVRPKPRRPAPVPNPPLRPGWPPGAPSLLT